MLQRPASARMVAGVAAGLARYFGVDVALVRVGFAVAAIIGFTRFGHFAGIPFYLAGIPLYVAGWLLIPDEAEGRSIASRFLAGHRGSAAS